MAEILPVTLGKAGTKPTLNNAAAGDTARCGDGYFLVAKNTTGSSVTLTIVVPGNTSYGEPNPDPQWTIAATTGEVWIPLIDAYRDPSDGKAHLTWSATGAGITRAVVKR
ncbi:hypothetical protein ABZS66_19235 [Dactylosporangium sp. NPDC005572]|uniref:hypothetical protein n=1 Tax=Dactylosporangium sp. NPDC005572 TaxID=3156889 RepID=UPI0033AF7F32